MNKIDIKQEAYFPFTFKLFGLILFAFGLLIWTQRELYFIAKLRGMITSFALGGAIVTARYGLLIDPVKKTINQEDEDCQASRTQCKGQNQSIK